MRRIFAASRTDAVESESCERCGGSQPRHFAEIRARFPRGSRRTAAERSQNMEGRVYGYARVSAKDQNLDRQMVALSGFPVDRKAIFADKASGKDFERPAYRRLVSKIKPGDVVVIKSIDRLGRNYEEILNEWRFITKVKKAAIVVIDMPLLDTRETKDNLTGVFIADIVLQLLSYVAQVERDNIKQRQAEGIAAAKARGVRFGRPPKRRPKNYAATKSAFLSGSLTRKEAAARLRIGTTTFSKWLKEDDMVNSDGAVDIDFKPPSEQKRT